jgi:ketosteroid isomerase-like protein
MTKLLLPVILPALAGLLATAAIVPAAAGATLDNKVIVRRVFTDIFNQGRYEVAAEIYAPDFKNHGMTRDVGLQEDQAAVRGWRAAAPDLIMTVDDEIAEGDKVVVLWRGVGTNTGSGNGYSETGARMQMRGITIWRLKDGKIVEEWSEFSEPRPAP